MWRSIVPTAVASGPNVRSRGRKTATPRLDLQRVLRVHVTVCVFCGYAAPLRYAWRRHQKWGRAGGIGSEFGVFGTDNTKKTRRNRPAVNLNWGKRVQIWFRVAFWKIIFFFFTTKIWHFLQGCADFLYPSYEVNEIFKPHVNTMSILVLSND